MPKKNTTSEPKETTRKAETNLFAYVQETEQNSAKNLWDGLQDVAKITIAMFAVLIGLVMAVGSKWIYLKGLLGVWLAFGLALVGVIILAWRTILDPDRFWVVLNPCEKDMISWTRSAFEDSRQNYIESEREDMKKYAIGLFVLAGILVIANVAYDLIPLCLHLGLGV